MKREKKILSFDPRKKGALEAIKMLLKMGVIKIIDCDFNKDFIKQLSETKK